MRVYRIQNDVNHYQYFLTEDEADCEKLVMDCTPRAESWVPPRVFVYMPRHKTGDFYQFGSSALITSPRATEVLRTHLEMAGELLPLPYEGQVFTVLNVTECINCLDQDETQWIYGESTGDKLHVAKYVFHTNRFSESEIFKLPETCKGEVLLAEGLHDPEEEFRYLVHQNGLEGLTFEEIWCDE
jgi:hypothetical protein